MVAAAYADLLSSVIEEKTFRTIQDGLYVQIAQRQGRILKGLFVADRRDPNFDLIYYAKEGMIDESGTSLTMRDGEVQQKTPDGKVSIVKFLSYAFDLSTMSEKQDSSRRSLRAMPASVSFSRPTRTMRATSAHRKPSAASLHKRLSDWMFAFSFALISLVIAADARSHREARLHPMVAALVTAFMLRWLGFTSPIRSSRARPSFRWSMPFRALAAAPPPSFC